MQTMTFEPLRWQDAPARVTVQANGSRPDVFYQVTSSASIEALCCGRPVEELPRILPILAPAHHLTAALALDRLFQVDPPEPARNMRAALLQAQYCTAHLRKIYFLATMEHDPFAGFRSASRGVHQPRIPREMLEKIMHHLGLAQEAEDILGGRHDHALTAMAGGVSRTLKEAHHDRLACISEALPRFARELAALLRTEVFTAGRSLVPWRDIEIPALAGLHLEGDQLTISDPGGNGPQQFAAEKIGAKIGMRQEAWTCQSFAFLNAHGWQGVAQAQGLFFTGPLARFNAGKAAATPLAEEERLRLIEVLGAPPQFTLAAAFAALCVELIQAAEFLQAHGTREKLTGPALRAIPRQMEKTTWAALEGPQGLMWHRYQVDDNGLVQTVAVIDAAAVNNALKCRLAGQVVCAALARKEDPAAIKERLEVALLPF